MIAINKSTESHELAVGTAANVSPIPVDNEWVMISPYGDFPNACGLQRVTKAHAEEMVTGFNSVLSKLGRLFRGLPIYVGHPDAMPERWRDERRLGRVNALEARNDGLYGQVAWNKLGQENLEEGYYVYPSPAWHYRETGAGTIEPYSLVSIGLTNTPQIQASRPWTNSDNPKTETKKTTMLKWLIEKLVAANVLAKPADDKEPTEAELQTAVGTLLQNHTTAINAKADADNKLTAANAAKSTLETQLTAANAARDLANAAAKKYRELARDGQIAIAINDGRLTPPEKPAFITKFDTDFDTAATELAEKKKAINTERLNLNRTTGADISTPEGRKIAFNARIDALMAQGCKTLNDAIAQMRAKPEDAALLKAMEEPAA